MTDCSDRYRTVADKFTAVAVAVPSMFLEGLLRAGGQYGPRIEVADDADEQTKLIASTGRTP